jgi:high-affinity nickel permease|tara:strand:+ start:1038 stop:1211 length:174 start_codon:yes stop_codon:yes gene_type:complete
MTQTILFLLIGIFIIILILLIHLYDRKIVKQIDDYEKNLEQKGILKRHYTKRDSDNK